MNNLMNDDKFKKSIFILSVSNLIVALAALITAIALLINLTGDTGVKSGKNIRAGRAVSGFKISKKYAAKMTYEEARKTGKPVALLFYTDWCNYCKKFAPLQYKLSQDSELSKRFTFVWINAEDKENNAEILDKFHIKAFPTLFLFDPQKDKKIQVSNKLMFTKTAEKDIKKIYTMF